MHKELIELLRNNPGLKAKEIAKRIDKDRKSVNRFLFSHPDDFIKDESHFWSLTTSELTVEFIPDWMDSDAFEDCLRVGECPLTSNQGIVRFVFPKGCSPMLDGNARLLALCNQLILDRKRVILDFSDNKQALTYLDRLGFLEHLSPKIEMLPQRPKSSRAKVYRGNSKALVEFGVIDPSDDNKGLINDLTDRFVSQSSGDYETAASTIFAEMIGNVKVHSESPIDGFAGLQKYKGRRKHIQTVVSDSGLGIFQTLEPVIDQYRKFHNVTEEPDFNIQVVEAVLTQGEISRLGAGQGRGLGFKSSKEQARKFDATLSVRQEDFSLKISFKNGKRQKTQKKTGLAKIRGTHLCFDFMVD